MRFARVAIEPAQAVDCCREIGMGADGQVHQASNDTPIGDVDHQSPFLWGLRRVRFTELAVRREGSVDNTGNFRPGTSTAPLLHTSLGQGEHHPLAASGSPYPAGTLLSPSPSF